MVIAERRCATYMSVELGTVILAVLPFVSFIPISVAISLIFNGDSSTSTAL